MPIECSIDLDRVCSEQARIQMKTQKFDTLTEEEARKLVGYIVIDASGEIIGTMQGLWIDFSTKQIAYIGVKSSLLSLNVHPVPAVGAQIQEGSKIIELQYSMECLSRMLLQ